MRKPEWVVGLVYLGVLALLPLWGHWARRGGEPTCAYDGGAVDPLYRVRIVADPRRDVVFCCVHCAEAWLRTTRAEVHLIQVTDESSGEAIDAASAYFVRSLVMTNPTTGNRVHAFGNKRDAEEHAAAFKGRLLEHNERPFGCCTTTAAPSSPR